MLCSLMSLSPSSTLKVARGEGRQGERLCRVANPIPASERGIGVRRQDCAGRS